MDKLASEGVLFFNALTPVPITLPSHSSIMTGLYPAQHGVRNNSNFFLSKGATTLAEVMKEDGYQTGACVGSFVLDSVFGLDQGFDYYNDNFTPEGKKIDTCYNERKAGEINKVAIQWLENHREMKFFLWLHYFDPHSPYFPPFPYSLNYVNHLYDGEIVYVDDCLGQLFEKMRSMGLMDKTVIILIGDHGEGLGEHKEDTHAIFIYDATLRIPFIIWAPALFEGGKNIHSLVTTIDIAPTVIRLFGLKPLNNLPGKDLMPLIYGEDKELHSQILCESLCPELNFGWSRLEGIRTPEWKYIRAPKPELFYLTKDPGERINLFEKKEDDHEKWEASLDRLRKDYPSAPWTAHHVELDPDTELRMKSLGYIWTRSAAKIEEEGPKPDPKDLIHVMNYLDNGMGFFLLGDYDQAIEEFRKIIEADKENRAAYFYLGWAYEEKGQLGEAEMFFRKSLEINPQNHEAYNNLGLIHYKRGEWDLALREFESSLDLFESPEVYYNVSLVYTKKEKAEEATASIKKALELDPEYADAWNHLGNLYLARNNLDEAAKHFEKTVELDPAHVKALNNLGFVYSQKGEIERGIEHFQLTVQLDPNNVEAHSNLGSLYLGQGKYDQAMAELKKALDMKPYHQNAMINLGMLYMSLTDYKKAESLFQKVIEIDKNYAEGYGHLGYLYLLTQESDKALSHYQQMLRLKPDNPEGYYYIGKAYQALGQKEAAIKAWQKSLALKPDADGVHLDLGNLYCEMGDFQKAQEEWVIAFAGKPVDIPTHLMNMGMLYLKLEEYENAIRVWQYLSELKPDDALFHYNLSLAYFKQGLYEDAYFEVKESLRLQAGSQEVYLLLEKIKQNL